MSLSDLQIHSDHPVDGPSFTQELDENAPKKQVFIGRDNPKRFYISVSAALLVLASIFFAAVLISTLPLLKFDPQHPPQDSESSVVGAYWDVVLGYNFRKTRHPYFRWATFLVLLSLILVSVYPELGRKRIRVFFLLLLFTGLGYVSWTYCAYQVYEFEPGAGHIGSCLWAYLFFFNASLSTFFAALASNRKPKWSVGLSVACALLLADIIFFQVFVPVSSPSPFGILVLFFLQGAISVYMTTDLEFMFTHRFDFYLVGDWFLGMVHLLTDWTFRFWHNAFVKRKRLVVRRASKVDVVSHPLPPPEAVIVEATTPKVSAHSIDTAIEEGDSNSG